MQTHCQIGVVRTEMGPGPGKPRVADAREDRDSLGVTPQNVIARELCQRVEKWRNLMAMVQSGY